jgi:hypothetical protein
MDFNGVETKNVTLNLSLQLKALIEGKQRFRVLLLDSCSQTKGWAQVA